MTVMTIFHATRNSRRDRDNVAATLDLVGRKDELDEEPTTREIRTVPWHEGPGFVPELDAPFDAKASAAAHLAR